MKPLKQWLLIVRFLLSAIPQVEGELKRWKDFLHHCPPSSPLIQQARASMTAKRFHCQGGAVFSLLCPPAMHLTIPLIVSFQTISDYLDNLCDRLLPEGTGSAFDREISDASREQAFRCLHNAMLCALNPDTPPPGDFYALYPYRDDGGYLEALVRRCQSFVKQLPSYLLVKEQAVSLSELYCDLQSLKHLSKEHRQSFLKKWFQVNMGNSNTILHWNEFAAAAGSTLGVFALFALASRKRVTAQEINQVIQGYFPWICGLHILLDYMIDQEEDRLGGDLNFVACYPGRKYGVERLKLFVDTALNKARHLENPAFHQTAVKGLLALYLSDPKIKQQGLDITSNTLLTSTKERDIFFLRSLCQGLRKGKVI